MGIARGTNIVRDSLVYGYDTGYNSSITGLDVQPHHNDYRFYKGIPATNVIKSGIPGYFGSGGTTLTQKTLNGFSSASGVFQRNFVNNPAQANTSTYNNNAGLFHSGLSFNNLSASTEYIMISFDFYMKTPYVKHSSSGTGLNGYLGVTYTDGSGDNHGWNTSLAGNAGDDWNNNSAYVGKWRKIALIADLTDSKTPSSINAMYIYNDRTIQGEGIFTNFVITEHATLPTSPVQWIAQSGSRSNTQCLIDLAGSQTIDVSNANFDSTGQPDFDGTDDRIVSSTGVNLSSYTSLTYEGVVKAVGLASHDRWFSGTVGSTFHNPDLAIGTDGQLGYIFSNSGIGSWNMPSGLTIDTTKFNHLVYTFTNAGVVKIYINGTQQHTATYSNATFPNGSKFMTGMRFDNNGEGVDGSIPIAKVYSKALTADEVMQNYKAYKNRFNL